MGKIKKILATFVVLISIFTFSCIKVDAATGTVTMTSNKSQVVVGNSVTFTVTVSSSQPIGVFQYNLSYDSSMLNLTSGDPSGAPVFTGKEKSVKYTFTFKAKKSGTATVKFNVSGGYTFEQEKLTLASKSKSVKIITQAELEASYSSNNNLSKLGVEGYNLSPSFSSGTTSYTVNLPANTESIKITGTKADSKASVEGLGTKTVEDGSNTFKIVVTAENGSTKTYTINAVVEELDPVTVTINNKTYTVIRKAKLLEKPSTDFIESTTKINDNDVPTLLNEKANITLVGLKDEEGNTELYIYNKEENTYTKYNQYTFTSLTLFIIDKEVENSNNKEEITINDEKINVYTLKNDSFYYFYAINLETGEENLYRYDDKEKTVQKYIAPEIEEIIEKENNEELYKNIILGLLAFIFLTYFIILLSLLFKGNKKNKKENNTKKIVEQVEPTELTKEEKEIHEEIEKIGTQELKLRDLNEIKDTKVSCLEKEKYIKESEEELNRISNENIIEENTIDEIVNEVFNSEEETDKKKKNKKTKKKKKE